MLKLTFRSFLWSCLGLCVSTCLCIGYAAMPQERVNSQIRVVVELVQLNVAVTDSRGNYVTGLQPGDFTVLEDGIPQKLATFAEGNEATRRLADAKPPNPDAKSANAGTEHAGNQPDDSSAHVSAGELASMLTGANVFVLFDTSNYMYRGFVFAQDAISDFVRSLASADRVASPFHGTVRGCRWRARWSGSRRGSPVAGCCGSAWPGTRPAGTRTASLRSGGRCP